MVSAKAKEHQKLKKGKFQQKKRENSKKMLAFPDFLCYNH